MVGSGTMRSSPTGPMPSTDWSRSSEFIASIASVTPIPLFRRASSPPSAVALARMVPSLPHHRKRTSIRPRSRAVLTMSMAEK